jgi:hypothetical protein
MLWFQGEFDSRACLPVRKNILHQHIVKMYFLLKAQDVVTISLTRYTLYPRYSYTYNGTMMPMFVQW